jgi:hypothetical protein
MLQQVRLVDGARQMMIRPRDGIALTKIDALYPEVRAVVEPATDTDGTNDTTQNFGASVVSLEARFYTAGTTRALIDELRSYCHPGSRPYLQVIDDEWATERRIQLRADQGSIPIEVGKGAVRAVQMAWRAPSGAWEDVSQTVTLVPAGLDDGMGLLTPVLTPITFNNSSGDGTRAVPNAGSVPLDMVLRVYGPCTGPTLVLMSTGEKIAFLPSCVLNAGEYIELNTRNRTAYFLSDPAQSRLGQIDFPNTDWWRVPIGGDLVRYAPYSAVTGSQCEVYTRTQWL